MRANKFWFFSISAGISSIPSAFRLFSRRNATLISDVVMLIFKPLSSYESWLISLCGPVLSASGFNKFLKCFLHVSKTVLVLQLMSPQGKITSIGIWFCLSLPTPIFRSFSRIHDCFSSQDFEFQPEHFFWYLLLVLWHSRLKFFLTPTNIALRPCLSVFLDFNIFFSALQTLFHKVKR